MRTLVIGATFAVLFPLAFLAQPAPQSQSGQQQPPVFRKQVNLVNVFFTVKDKHGALMPNLNKDQFELLEDGKPQNIRFFASESNQPLTLGILIDSSGSMQHMLPEEKVVAGDFLRQVITDKDLAFVESFDVNVDLLQDLTSNIRLLRSGLDKAKINVGGGSGGIPGIGQGPVPISRPKGTLLYDGVFLASDELLSRQVGRKAVVVLTDGVDQGSKMRLKDSIEAAQKSDVIVYVLLISDPGYGSAPHEMGQMAEQTGGRLIVVNNPDKLHKAFAEISSELRSQYNIGYYPVNEKHDGSFRKIEIKSKDGYKIQARKGYYAPME
jgi:VWFA-related protein